MKKIILLLICLFPGLVFADRIYSIDMNIDIQENGDAFITEVWDVKADSGSEWYKTMYEIEVNNSEIKNFLVLMDGNELEYKKWNVNENIGEKAGYYGINEASKGLELCFGKSDFKRHTFTLTYTLTNYVFNVSDAQVIAQVIMPKISTDNFKATILGYYNFEGETEFHTYGFDGIIYSEGGKIVVESNKGLDDNYVSVLVKVPSNTYNTTNKNSGFSTYSEVFSYMQKGADDFSIGWFFAIFFGIWAFVLGFIALIFNIIKYSGYGFTDNKTINQKTIPNFRDIPCNKDIYYASSLLFLNNQFDFKESRLFCAILLKWLKKDIIGISKDGKKTNIILKNDSDFLNNEEKTLYMYLKAAAKDDNVVEEKELKNWCNKNYEKFFKLFEKMKDNYTKKLKDEGHIRPRKDKEECKYKNVMDDTLYEDSIKLYGLKKFLIEFSNMKQKEPIEVKLWDEYLMFASLYGIADKVSKQLEKLYPEVINSNDFDYNSFVYINHLSNISYSSANSARSSASGGGYSGGISGGGGGSAGGR